jgi:hypothetical protein
MTRSDSAATPFGVFDASGTTAGSEASELHIPHPRTSPDGSVSVTAGGARAENRLRGMMVDRLTLMADRHRRHAQEQQGTRRAVGPHAIGFFYADDLEISGTLEVVTATRLFFDSAETNDVVAVLDTLIARASEHPAGTFEPRTHMCNRAEPMSPTPQLLGVGLTTVSEPPPSEASSAYASLGMNRRYRAVARMVDGTEVLLRCDSGFLAPVDVRATQSLNVNGRHTRHWEWLPPALLHRPETQLTDILPRLTALLDLTTGQVAATPPGHPPAAPRGPIDDEHHRSGRQTVRLGNRRRRH